MSSDGGQHSRDASPTVLWDGVPDFPTRLTSEVDECHYYLDTLLIVSIIRNGQAAYGYHDAPSLSFRMNDRFLGPCSRSREHFDLPLNFAKDRFLTATRPFFPRTLLITFSLSGNFVSLLSLGRSEYFRGRLTRDTSYYSKCKHRGAADSHHFGHFIADDA